MQKATPTSLAKRLLFSVLLAAAAGQVAAQQPKPNIELFSSFKYSGEARVKADQAEANKVIEQYVIGLNTANIPLIVSLFADDAAALWNEKPSYLTNAQRTAGYTDLFKVAKFDTVFVIDKTEVYGEIAIVRTHHKLGQEILWNGKKMTDFDREIFVMRKDSGKFKVIAYMFNNNQFQGQE